MSRYPGTPKSFVGPLDILPGCSVGTLDLALAVVLLPSRHYPRSEIVLCSKKSNGLMVVKIQSKPWLNMAQQHELSGLIGIPFDAGEW